MLQRPGEGDKHGFAGSRSRNCRLARFCSLSASGPGHSGSGERRIEHGTPAGAIALVVRGKVRLSKDGRVLGELRAGDIVGSALLLSGAPAEVDAVTAEPLRALRWEVAALRPYLEADPETRIVFQRNLTRDLAGKLRRLGEDYLRQSP
jgi:CRP-like cAMP-binding protein